MPESKNRINKEGKNVSSLKHSWRAKWITHPTASVFDYGVFLFRRTFNLDVLPNKFVIYISADNRYKLFINNKKVSFGPAIGSIDYYNYDKIDVTKFLKVGKNIIGVEVVNFGEYKRVAQQSFSTAFILQSDKANNIVIDTGDGNWKVIQDKAFNSIPFDSKKLYGYYAAGPGDEFKANLHPWGWKTLSFNDFKWLKPKIANIEFAAGRGFIYGSTWFLVPREIEFLEEKEQNSLKIVRIKGPVSIKKHNALTIPANSRISVLFDNKFHTIGFPQITISKGNKSKIKITYAESLINNDAYKKKYIPANIQLQDVKGNRNIIDNKKILGVYDIIHPDGENHHVFTPLWIRTFRYIQLDIHTKSEKLILENINYNYVTYPFKQKAKFETDDSTLAKLWEVAWRTFKNSSGETFMDSPYYEQLQYIGDSRIASLISVYISNNDKLFRNAIKIFDNSRIPEGLTQSRYPAYIKQIIPTYSLFWVSMLYDYLLYRTDPDFIEQFLESIKNILEWFIQKIDDTNLLTGLEWWLFVDWADGFPNGIPPGADDGYSTFISLQFLYTLNQSIEIFKNFGKKYEVNKYSKIAKKIKKAVYENCYAKKEKLFAETPKKKNFSQHTNIMAILSDAVPMNEQKKIITKIINNKEIIQTTIYFKFYLFRALQKTKSANDLLDLLTPWKRMIDKGLTTFAEVEKNPRSDCHIWSSYPIFDFLHTVAGIYPTEFGFKNITVEPNFGYLKKIKAKLLHPQGGAIKINLERIGKLGIKGSVTLPKNQYGNFYWNNNVIKLKAGTTRISLNK